MRWLPLLTGIGAVGVLLALLFVKDAAPWLTRLDHWTVDWRTAYLSPAPAGPHPRIAIVAVTDETLKNYPSSPIDRELMSRIVTAIDQAEPKAIGLDLLFFKKTDPAKDTLLIETLKTTKAPVFLGMLDSRGKLDPERGAFQSDFISQTGRPAGYINLRTETDGVVRYAAGGKADPAAPFSLAALLAKADGMDVGEEGAPIQWTLPGAPGSLVFEEIPAHDLLGPDAAQYQARLKDRLVLVGGVYALPPRDIHRTPLSVRSGEPMPGVRIHAHILSGLLDPAGAMKELSGPTTQALLAAVGVLGLLVGWTMWQSPLVGFLRWTFATGALLAIDAYFFSILKLHLPFTLALVAWFAGVTAGSALRAARASRSR